MLFTLLLYGLVMGGSLLMFIDTILLPMGVPLLPMVSTGFKTMGVVIVFLGVILYHSRMEKTGGGKLGELPDPNITKVFHLGKSGMKIYNGKKCEPNRIRVKVRQKKGWGYMNIKDTGDNVNVAGHDVVFSSQDIGHTIPLWLVDAVEKWKRHYGVRNEDEFLALYEQIKGITCHDDLKAIDFLKPIVRDPVKWAMLEEVDIDTIREMKELLFDARTINVKEYLDWAEGATPYDNEAIIDSTISQMRSQDLHLLKTPTGDFTKIVIPLVILLLIGGIAYQMFGG